MLHHDVMSQHFVATLRRNISLQQNVNITLYHYVATRRCDVMFTFVATKRYVVMKRCYVML